MKFPKRDCAGTIKGPKKLRQNSFNRKFDRKASIRCSGCRSKFEDLYDFSPSLSSLVTKMFSFIIEMARTAMQK